MTKISALPVASALTGAEIVPLDQNGQTRQTTVRNFWQILPDGNSVNVTANTPLNGLYLSGSTTGVNWCPGTNFGCAPPATFASQVASVSTTSGAPNVQESNIFVLMNANTGQLDLWVQNHVYTAGQYAEANGNIYLCIVSGTSSNVGSGPSGTGNNIVDNSVTWNYAGPNYSNGKNGVNSNVVASAGAGKVWNFTGGLKLNTGWAGRFAAGMEIDILNFSGTDLAPFGAQIAYGLYIGGQNASPFTAGIYISPGVFGGGTFGCHYGLWFDGSNTIKENNIAMSNTGATNGIVSFGTNFSNAFITDSGTSNVGIDLQGTYSAWPLRIKDVPISWTTGLLTFGGGIASSSLRVNQTPTAVGTGTKTISNVADSSTNFGHYFSVNLNGTTYFIPCSSVAPT